MLECAILSSSSSSRYLYSALFGWMCNVYGCVCMLMLCQNRINKSFPMFPKTNKKRKINIYTLLICSFYRDSSGIERAVDSSFLYCPSFSLSFAYFHPLQYRPATDEKNVDKIRINNEKFLGFLCSRR